MPFIYIVHTKVMTDEWWEWRATSGECRVQINDCSLHNCLACCNWWWFVYCVTHLLW